MNKPYLVALLVLISCYACTQNQRSNTENAASLNKNILKDKLKTYIAADSVANAAKADPLQALVSLPGIQGSWVNVDFKKYLLKETTIFSPSMVPFAVRIDKKGAVFTNQRETEHNEVMEFRSAVKNRYQYGTLNFIKDNDSTISVNRGGQKLVFLKAGSSVDGVELTRELTVKMIDYSRIKTLVRIDELLNKTDTVAMNCAKAKGSNFILCSTPASDFKYSISYDSPKLWIDSFIRAKYYVTIEGLDKEPKTYEMEAEQHQVLLKKLDDEKVKYKFLY